ncbi:MAG: hypothetical protein UD936_09430 [Acutalibacteraceae bacterium]|nr:hypothetical protein [Acutalibacteraceae bacterium]
MLKKVLALTCSALLITASMSGCGCQKKEGNTEPTSAPVQVVKDPEAARVSTLDKFLKNSRSFTIDEKVLRFFLDNAQMEYTGFKATDTSQIEAIAPGQTVTDIEYKNDNGLTAYVDMKNRGDEVLGYKRTNSVKIYKIRMIKGNSKSQLHLPNKLGWDTSIDQFKKDYGTPLSEETNADGNTVITYGEEVPELKEGYTMALVFEKDKLIEFTIEVHDAV